MQEKYITVNMTKDKEPYHEGE